jgi:uncharacterized protein (DUF3084 family)
MAAVLIGVLLSGVGTATAVPLAYAAEGAIVRVADTPSGDFDARRDEYMRRAQSDFQQWQNRMKDWAADAQAKGHEVSQQTRQEVNEAWNKVQANWKNLQGAAPSTWDKARDAFDEASRRLKSAWEKIQPEG